MATRFIQNYIQELLNEHIPPGWSPPGGAKPMPGRPGGTLRPMPGPMKNNHVPPVPTEESRRRGVRTREIMNKNPGMSHENAYRLVRNTPDTPDTPQRIAQREFEEIIREPETTPMGSAQPGRSDAPVDRLYRVTDRDRAKFDRFGPIRVQDKQHIRPGGRQPIGGMPSPMPGGGARPGPSIEQEMINRRRGQGQQYPPPVQSGRTPVDSPPRTTSGGGPDPYDRILYGRGNDPSRDRRNMVDELRAQDERYKRRGKDPNVRELRRGGLEAGLSSAERNRPGAYGDPTRGGGALPSWYNEQYVAEAAGPEGRELSQKVNKHFNEIRGFIGAISGGKANEFQDHVHDGVFSGHDNHKIIDTHGPLKNHGMKSNGDDYTPDIHNYIDAVRAHHDYKTDVRDDSEKFYTGE